MCSMPPFPVGTSASVNALLTGEVALDAPRMHLLLLVPVCIGRSVELPPWLVDVVAAYALCPPGDSPHAVARRPNAGECASTVAGIPTQ
jgi:hypothetical protein